MDIASRLPYCGFRRQHPMVDKLNPHRWDGNILNCPYGLEQKLAVAFYSRTGWKPMDPAADGIEVDIIRNYIQEVADRAKHS
jgi:hypothetical protein